MNQQLISVLTTTFNRCDKISRVFDSLSKSTYKNFELIIIDDGSTDDTSHVVESYVKKVDYPVRYLKKNNGGKHTAINLGYRYVNGEFIFHLDSDDEIMPNAMETALRIWNSIPINERKNYWCVCGRMIDSKNSYLIGKLFPQNINKLDWRKSQRVAQKINGDKFALQVSSIVMKFPFPEPKHVKFVQENLVWSMLDNEFRQFYTNEVFAKYYIGEGSSLSHPIKNKQTIINNYFNYLSYIESSRSVSILNFIKFHLAFALNDALLENDIKKDIGYPHGINSFMQRIVKPFALFLFINKYKRKFNII